MRRPTLLVKAARFNVAEGHTPSARTLAEALAVEAVAEEKRLTGAQDYHVAAHVEALMDVIALARIEAQEGEG